MKNYLRVNFIFSLIIIVSCNINDISKPNVILIMADDIGYEALSINGANDIRTPVLDSLARNGINFKNAYSQPLCTPSRVKIMTGKPNYENYEYFTYLNPKEKTFGNLFQDNGYKTLVAGKWQLNGVQFKLDDYTDLKRPYTFGFDSYMLWWLAERGSRFANPVLVNNEKKIDTSIDDYGPEIVSDYIVDFINEHSNSPFFIYYPMMLVHDPFLPTPNSKDWENEQNRLNSNNPEYFSEMVSYMDSTVGKIINTLKNNNIDDNTIIIFLGDNGTDRKVFTKNNNVLVKGSKGLTNKYGTNVPLIISWSKLKKIKNEQTPLVDLIDFYSTFEDLLNVEKKTSNGVSLLPLLLGENFDERKYITTYYNPMWGSLYKNRAVYIQNKKYKLYKSGSFYNYQLDPEEMYPLSLKSLDESIMNLHTEMDSILKKVPDLPEINFNNWQEKLKASN
jgi:arylsulfatase A